MYSESKLFLLIKSIPNLVGLKKINNEQLPLNSVKKRFTVRYLVAVSLVFMVTLIGNTLLYFTIAKQATNADIINIATEQRMLMQRVAALTAMVHFEDNAEQKQSSIILLLASGNKMEKQHLQLTEFVTSLSESNKQGLVLQAYYFNEPIQLHDKMLKFHQLLYQFINTVGTDEKIMRQITAQSIGPLLDETDRTVVLYQKITEQTLASTTKTLETNTIFVMLVLLAQITFIFRPLARKLTNQASELDHKATIDNLTGLFNRQTFESQFTRVIENAHQRGESALLIIIDVDGFKEINHTEGNTAGDEVLRQIGKRLRALISPTLQVTRLAGDEFALITVNSFSSDESLTTAKKIKQIAIEPITYKGRLLRITVTIGMASFPDDAINLKELLLAANYSLRLAKQQERGTIQAFMPVQRHAIERDKIIIQSLERREHLEGLFMEFQPLIDLKTQHLTGCEALVRWDHPQLGTISPDQFLKLAVSHGHGAFIGEIIRRRAMKGFKALRTAGLKIPSLSLNLMDVELKSLSGPAELIEQLNLFGLTPQDIEIEVTEDVVLGHLGNELERKLIELRHAGFRLGLDDFGTGFATLEHLIRLDVDVIKLDRTFVAKIKKDQRTRKIINAIIKLAHGLSAKVVAEGIETEEQLEILKSMSCDIGQGFILARPMPVTKLIAWHKHYS
jgi:diguanylate cyclase (GGDEF)-like protein